MKRKTVSAEDLKNLLKEMINGAVKDSEQMEKLHRIICEEWSHNKVAEWKPVNSDVTTRKSTSSMAYCEQDTNNSLSSGSGHRLIVRAPSKNSNSEDQYTQQSRKKLSFEAWKDKKTAHYKEILKNQKIEKQRVLSAMLADQERKRQVQEEQERVKRQYLEQQRLYKKYLETTTRANMEAQESQAIERRMINEKAFEEWKKRKDAKLKKDRRTMRNYQEQFIKEETVPARVMTGVTMEFNTWLNQLNWVLHEKYLRERRYLVRSFYCQPTYYGDMSVK